VTDLVIADEACPDERPGRVEGRLFEKPAIEDAAPGDVRPGRRP
jgi:hypothetical protein